MPEAWDRELALASLRDEDPSPDVVEVDLDARVGRVEIAPGQTIEAWTYAGVSPGPTIRARVGQTLRVHFTNRLPEATTIHWHGLEVPADQDGAGEVGASVAPGESFDYEFKLLHAGTYWYHPHLNSAEQVWRGLYGALIVAGDAEPDLGDELTLLLHDVQLDADSGELAPAAAQGALGRFFGDEGDTLLVNGRVLPELLVYPGSSLRLRVINASISRYYQLAVEGHTLRRVAGDSGFSDRSQSLDDSLLIPGQRAEFVLTIQASAGATLALRSLPYDRFPCGGTCGAARDLLSLVVEPGEGHSRTVPELLVPVDALDLAGANPRQLVLSETLRAGQTKLAIDGHVYGEEDPLTLEASVGSSEVWTVENQTDYDHPFHLHGFRFQVLAQDGHTPAVREWADTVNVVAHTTVRVGMHFDDRPGMWMFHCHILDHAELGMMGMLHLH